MEGDSPLGQQSTSGKAKKAAGRSPEARELDELLVKGLLAGDNDAWRKLVDGYGGLIAVVARRVFSSRGYRLGESEIEDVVENTFLSLLRDDSKLLLDYNSDFSFATWLGVLARTQCHRIMRGRSPLVGLPSEVVDLLEDSNAVDVAEALSREETVELVRKALDFLNHRERTVLRLFYFERKGYKEIGEALSLSVNSVGAAMSRARAAFKSRFESLVKGGVVAD